MSLYVVARCEVGMDIRFGYPPSYYTTRNKGGWTIRASRATPVDEVEAAALVLVNSGDDVYSWLVYCPATRPSAIERVLLADLDRRVGRYTVEISRADFELGSKRRLGGR